MRAWLVLLLAACESGAAPEASAPAPAPAPVEPSVEPEQPSECKSLARLLLKKCSGLEFDLDRCSLVDEPFGDHGKGRSLHFGTSELWFVAPDGFVFSHSDEARAACPDLPTLRDYDRSRARKSAEKARENDPTACSLADLRVADIVADHEDVALSGWRSVGGKPGPEIVAEVVAEGIKRAAEETGMKRAKVRATLDKVRKICPKAM